MKTRISILLAVAALALCLPACSMPGSSSGDPMRNAMGFAGQTQMQAHGQISMDAARQPSRAGMFNPSFAPSPRFPSFQPFAQ